MRSSTCGRLITGTLVVAVGLLVGGCTAGDRQPEPGAPDVAVSEPDGGDSGHEAAVIECLRDRGWEIVVYDDGWGAPGTAESQYDAYVADTEACVQLNTVIEPLESISEERWESAYARQSEFVRCLHGLGYDIPAIPSFQAWKESFFVGEDAGGQWSPWKFLSQDSLSGEDFRALQEACPQPAGP